MSNSVGIRVKMLRRDANKTQSALATEIGEKQVTISRLEKGNIKHPSLDLVTKLAKSLGVSVDSLQNTQDNGAALTNLFDNLLKNIKVADADKDLMAKLTEDTKIALINRFGPKYLVA